MSHFLKLARSAAVLAAAAGTVFAFAVPALAWDFNNPKDKDILCQYYANGAMSDAKKNREMECGGTGNAWGENYKGHYDWCMGQRTNTLISSETKGRQSRIAYCGKCSSYVDKKIAFQTKWTAIQCGRKYPGRSSGDLVVFDSARAARVSSRPSSGRKCSSAIALMIPKSSFSWVDAEDRLTNVCIPRTKLLAPLSTTLNFLSSRLTEDVGEEFLGLYDACVAMLPIAAGCFDKRSLALEMRGASRPLREIVEFIDDSLRHANLTAQIAADALGLSERYVHKLFAKQGSTFGAYVTAKRLEHARNELMGPQRPSKPISLIAYGSGFNDLSTFNRAFRKQFGCTPSAMRDSKVKEPNAE